MFGDFGAFFPGGDVTGERIWSFDALLGPDAGVTPYELSYLSGDGLDRVLGFGTDGAGGLYVSDFGGATGELYRVVSAQVAAVPLPAAAGMLMAGLALLGLRGWR